MTRAIIFLHMVLAASFWLCAIGAYALTVNEYHPSRLIVALLMTVIAAIMTPTTHEN